MSTHCPATARTAPAKARLGRKLAALAGATGAVAAGTAEAVPYTPTAGVAAAQGIPGFSFNASTNTATLGSLRPPVTPNTAIAWDIDGVGAADFQVKNSNPFTALIFARLGPLDYGNSLVGVQSEGLVLSNLAAGVAVNNAQPFGFSSVPLTANGGAAFQNQNFLEDTPGQFGFQFASGGNSYYGWGTLVIDYLAAGRGFQITEAYYNTIPDAGINVGAVPAPVPEPSSIALLAIGAAGVTAWRARRKRAE